MPGQYSANEAIRAAINEAISALKAARQRLYEASMRYEVAATSSANSNLVIEACALANREGEVLQMAREILRMESELRVMRKECL